MQNKGKKNIEKIVNILLNILVVFFGFILLVSIYIGFQTKVLKKNYADFFGYSAFEVQTGSMEKAITPGDWIIIKLTKDVKLNDIITYQYKGEYITHRIIEVYSGTYITKGDANTAKDDPVDQSQVVGKVSGILKGFGLLRKTIFNPTVIIALIITLFLFNIALSQKNKETENKIFDSLKRKIKALVSRFKKNIVKEEIKVENLNEETINKSNDEDIEVAREEANSLVEEENELDKTILFRVVAVDSSEIDDTLLEAAESKINSNELKKEPKAITAKNLVNKEKIQNKELLKIKANQKNKKPNNLIESVMLLKEQEIEEIIALFITDMKNGINIKNDFIKTYIESKYYNINEEKNSNVKSITKNIKLNIKNKANEFFKLKPKSRAVINDCLLTLNLIAVLEQAKETIDDFNVRNEFYKKEIMKYSNDWDEDNSEYMVEKINNIQEKYSDLLKTILEKVDTSIFELKLTQLVSYKNIYGARLDHNLSFSKVYSDYIIDKTYTEGIVAEDKLLVLISLLMKKIINDMLNYQFSNKYIIYIPESLYLKEKKIASILRILDNKYIKNNVYIAITFDELSSNKKIVKEIRKREFSFALVFDKEYKINSKDNGYMYLASYIFINKKEVDAETLISHIPKDLIKIVNYENIEEKVGIKGEQL